MIPPYLLYLLFSAMVSSVAVSRKWYGTATFFLLVFVWVLMSVAFQIPVVW